jgi:hypothetical protein
MSEKPAPPKRLPKPDGIANFFWHLQDLYYELKPCRFVFIVAIIGAIVFAGVEQGREVLRALAEPGASTSVTGALRLTMFGTGLAIWSLASWYSARVLLYFDFPKSYEVHPRWTGIWGRLHSWLQRNVPRILGVAPMAIVGWSFLRVRFKIWPGQGSLIETTFRQQVVQDLKTFDANYADWILREDHRGGSCLATSGLVADVRQSRAVRSNRKGSSRQSRS